MKKYLIDISLCLVLAGVITVQYTIGFSRLYIVASERLGGAVEAVTEDSGDGDDVDPCPDLVYDRDHVDDALKCHRPFVDPTGGLVAADRPEGHRFSVMLFAVFFPLFAIVAIIRNRRDIADWLAERRAGPLVSPVPSRAELLLVLVVFSVAVFFRVFELGSWVVEESEWGAVERLPLVDLMFHGSEVMHEPPLFPSLQHFVYAINDHSLAWTRSLTCLTGILLVMAVWRSSRSIFGPKTSLLATALAAVHPFLVSNSHVMRPYSLASFFMVMLLPHAYRMASGLRKRDVVAFSIFGGLAIWTHYTALIGLLVLFIYMAASVVLEREHRMKRLLHLVVAGLALTVFFLPFAPYFFSDFAGKQGFGISMNFVDDMLAAITGLPFGAGWIVVAFPLVTGLRRARSGRFLMFVSGGILAIMAATVWMVWWEPTHMAFLAPLLMMTVAASAQRLKARLAPVMISPYFVGMTVVSCLLFSLPSTSPAVWEVARPMTWHGMSYKVQADRALDVMAADDEARKCTDLYVTPVDQVSGFMYYWGPVTPHEIGMRPIEPNNFKTFRMDVHAGDHKVGMNLHPIERLWSWEKGQWLDLELALREKGCLWYHKSYQNCALKTGRFFSTSDCAWLADNCRAVVSMPDGELWLCSRRR